MTNGQISQLQDLSRCYMRHREKVWVEALLTIAGWGDMRGMTKFEEAWLRKWTHQYRHQIRAIKRNRREAE